MKFGKQSESLGVRAKSVMTQETSIFPRYYLTSIAVQLAFKPGLNTHQAASRGTRFALTSHTGRAFHGTDGNFPTGGADSRERRTLCPAVRFAAKSDLHVNGVPFCPDCDETMVGKDARSFAEVTEGVMRARSGVLRCSRGPSWRSRRHRGNPQSQCSP
jgi:hypothetical protein